MAWEKPDEEMRKLLDKVLVDFDCEKKKMFGYPVFFVNNNMFTGVHGRNLFMRFPKDEIPGMLEKDGITPFEPREGLIMREYIVVDRSIANNSKKFSDLLNKSYKYTISLPPKEKKPKKSGKKK